MAEYWIASTSAPPGTPPNGAAQHQVELPRMEEAAHGDGKRQDVAAAGRQAAAGDPRAGDDGEVAHGGELQHVVAGRQAAAGDPPAGDGGEAANGGELQHVAARREAATGDPPAGDDVEAAHDGERQHVTAGRQAAAGDPPAGNDVRINIDPPPRSQGIEAGSQNASEPFYEREAQEETALHEAVRQRNGELIRQGNLREFAAKGNINDMPPLYLAIFLGYSDITEELIATFGESLSYNGPDGQNVLHVAALRSKDLTQRIIAEKPDLRNAPDDSGSIPLHFAASAGVEGVTTLLLGEGRTGINKADGNEMRPIHVAASVGAMDAVRALLNHPPDEAPTPRDNRGRTFLHVAVENNKTDVVKFVCGKHTFTNILNMKDNDGNTVLHLAIQNRDESIFGYLVGNRDVELNLVNEVGYTPLDLASKIKIENSFASHQHQNPTEWMIRVLAHSGAYFSARRRDLGLGTEENNQQVPLAPTKESSVLVASALIATVTFAAAFTMPGSYRIGDDPKAGTPELGRLYGFKVFLVADILAFYCSVAATFSLAEYGNRGNVDPLVRHTYARRAVWLFHIALRSVIVAFALGVSVVMWDISVTTTVIVGIAALALVVYGNEALAHDLRFMWVMYCRFGFSPTWKLYPSTSSHLEWTTRRLKSFSWTLVSNMFKLFWTYGLIFVVAYIATLKLKDGH